MPSCSGGGEKFCWLRNFIRFKYVTNFKFLYFYPQFFFVPCFGIRLLRLCIYIYLSSIHTYTQLVTASLLCSRLFLSSLRHHFHDCWPLLFDHCKLHFLVSLFLLAFFFQLVVVLVYLVGNVAGFLTGLVARWFFLSCLLNQPFCWSSSFP